MATKLKIVQLNVVKSVKKTIKETVDELADLIRQKRSLDKESRELDSLIKPLQTQLLTSKPGKLTWVGKRSVLEFVPCSRKTLSTEKLIAAGVSPEVIEKCYEDSPYYLTKVIKLENS